MSFQEQKHRYYYFQDKNIHINNRRKTKTPQEVKVKQCTTKKKTKKWVTVAHHHLIVIDEECDPGSTIEKNLPSVGGDLPEGDHKPGVKMKTPIFPQGTGECRGEDRGETPMKNARNTTPEADFKTIVDSTRDTTQTQETPGTPRRKKTPPAKKQTLGKTR